MIRKFLVIGLAASAAACASTGAKPTAAVSPPRALTPTQQYVAKVTHAPDEVLLAPHAQGLSERQAAAVDELVGRWRETGGQAFTIAVPNGPSRDAARAAEAVESRLIAVGVAPALIHTVGYDPAERPGAPLSLSYERFQAEGPKCGQDWRDFTKTSANTVNANFGCANTANLAALVANPADLNGPRALGDPDAGRRENVLNKYRQGQITSSAKDDQATGAISNAVH